MYRHSIIKSIWPYTGTITGANTSAVVAITPVVLANAIFIPLGGGAAGADAYATAEYLMVRGQLTDVDEVTLIRAQAPGVDTGTIRFQILELKSGIVAAIVRDTVALSAAVNSNTKTVASWPDGKRWLLPAGMTIDDASGDWSDSVGNLDDTDVTTVTGRRTSHTAGVLTIGFTRVHFR